MSYAYPPATSYHDLYARFGNPADPDFESTYIIESEHQIAGGKTIAIRHHKFIAQPLHDVFTDLITSGAINDLTEFDGAYVVRNVRGFSAPSLHSWGLALDFNASQIPLGSLIRLPHDVLVAWKAHGFFYGGDFIHRKDGMHLEFSNGVI